MFKAKVSVVKVEDYKREELQAGLIKSLDLLGGIENIIKPKSKVFIKINHLSPPSPPERAIITHPSLTREIILLLKDLNCVVTVGDDIQSGKKDGFLVSGYRQMCEELSVQLVNFKESGFQEVKCDGQVLKKTYISPLILETDFILNLPKLKTHSFTVYTGAIKNMFGIIPFGLRLSYHRRYVKNETFSQMLLDVFSCAPPALNIMDGVVAMEGEGPGSGNPKRTGILLASVDAVALDAVASKIIGFNPFDVYTTLFAQERGLGIGKLEDITILGEKIRDVKINNFKHSALATGLLSRKIPQFLHGYIQDQLTLTPEIVNARCTVCEECINICPASAVRLFRGFPLVDKNICIHCMCCHEVCRFQAIKLKKRPAGMILKGASSLYRRTLSLFS